MMNLAEYRNRNTRLADYLPWVALVGQGVVLNKDGSFQRTARFRGPDLDSAVPAELIAVAGRLNNAFRRLGSGWAIFVEAQRHPSNLYPDSRFPDAASALVDAERKASFEEAGTHFESSYFLTFTYLPPAEDAARAESWLYEGRETKGIDPHEFLTGFADRTDRVLRLVDAFMPECRWLDDTETLTYLHGCVSTKRHRVRVPETPMYLDALLADQPLAGGLEPRLGDEHLRVLTITGFATQSLSDIDGSVIAPAIIESCQTRLLLPNERAIEPQITAIYRRFGLNDRQIEILARATPKRDYYCQSRRGNRLFELGLSEVALALCATSAKTDQTAIARILAEHGRTDFLAAWLRERSVDWAADLIPDLSNLIPQPKKETDHEDT